MHNVQENIVPKVVQRAREAIVVGAAYALRYDELLQLKCQDTAFDFTKKPMDAILDI